MQFQLYPFTFASVCFLQLLYMHVFNWLNDELKVDILMDPLYFGLVCTRVWHGNSYGIRTSNETNQ